MAERNAAAGYLSIGQQTAPGTPVTPTILTPYYKQSLETNLNLIQDKPVYGSKFEIFQQLQSSRSHKGSLTVMAEPFTAMYWADMALTLLSTTGSAPSVVRTYGLSNTVDPKFYTVDINLVSQVVRFFGVAASKLAMPFVNEEMQFDLSVSALGSFYGREIASIASQVVTLSTTYDPAPTTGLVVGDLITIKSIDGVTNLNTLTISAVTPTTVTVVGTITSATAGMMLVLRPNTALTLSTQTPFLWPLTQYKYGATLSAAQSAAQTRLEVGTTLEIDHKFESDDGSKRSGGFDPASLIRTTGLYMFKTKQYFDNPDQLKVFNNMAKNACQIISTSGATASLAVNLNHFKVNKDALPTTFGQTIYQELEYGPQYDQTDGVGFTLVVTNASASM